MQFVVDFCACANVCSSATPTTRTPDTTVAGACGGGRVVACLPQKMTLPDFCSTTLESQRVCQVARLTPRYADVLVSVMRGLSDTSAPGWGPAKNGPLRCQQRQTTWQQRSLWSGGPCTDSKHAPIAPTSGADLSCLGLNCHETELHRRNHVLRYSPSPPPAEVGSGPAPGCPHPAGACHAANHSEFTTIWKLSAACN